MERRPQGWSWRACPPRDSLGDDLDGLGAHLRDKRQRASFATYAVVGRRPHAVGIEPAQGVPQRLDELLHDERVRGFARLAGAALFIDRQFEVMRRFIEALP